MHGRSLRFALLALSILTLGTAHAATVSPVAPGLSAAIGQAFHPVTQEVFFVEWTSGEFSKVDPASGTVTTINNGFVNPQDVALLPGHPLAYITTRDGKLWKVATGSAAKSQVTSGLGKPHQLVLDPAAFVAYTVDFAGGNFWKVSLGGGVPTAIATGLTNPLGLVMTPDFKTAYISEPNRILKVDVASGTSTVVISGLSNLFFMDWADDVQSALYVVSRDPANYLLRVDLTATPAGLSKIAPVPFRPSSVVRSGDPNVLYVASDSVISRVELVSPGGPTITRVGHIPSTKINWSTGLATTDPGYFFYVKNASFGGKVHLMLNFPGMRAGGARYYRVYVDGGPSIGDVAQLQVEWIHLRAPNRRTGRL